MLLGVFAGIGACALWGLAFIAPLVAAPYSPFDLTVARYLLFGFASLALLASRKFHALRKLRWSDLIHFAALGFAGNVGYYLAASLAVPLVGPEIVALVIRTLPVIIGLLGNRGRSKLPLRELAVPLLLIVLGLCLVNGTALATANMAGTTSTFAAGLALTIVATALWAWYGVRNASALAARPVILPAEWTALTGVGTLLALIPVLPIGWALGLSNVPSLGFEGLDAMRFFFWALILAALPSWAATWAWSITSRSLPLSLAGQLIVFETIFALAYGAFYNGQLPNLGEVSGAALMLAGVVAVLRIFSRQRIPTA